MCSLLPGVYVFNCQELVANSEILKKIHQIIDFLFQTTFSRAYIPLPFGSCSCRAAGLQGGISNHSRPRFIQTISLQAPRALGLARQDLQQCQCAMLVWAFDCRGFMVCGGLWHDCEHWLGRRKTRCTSGVCRLARDGSKVMASFLTSQIPVHRDGNCLPTQNTDHARHRTASLSVMASYWMDGDSCECSRCQQL